MKTLLLSSLLMFSSIAVAGTPNMEDVNLAYDTDRSSVEANPNVPGEPCPCRKNSAPCALGDNTNPSLGGSSPSSPTVPTGAGKGVGG